MLATDIDLGDSRRRTSPIGVRANNCKRTSTFDNVADMRIAVLADIHGNISALEAVLADIRGRSADLIVNLGDCVSGPLWPRETFERLEQLGAPTVRGNHDRQVAILDPAQMGASDRFAFSELSDAQRKA